MNGYTTALSWAGTHGAVLLPGRSLIRTSWLDDLGEVVTREAEPKRFSFCNRAERGASELTLLALPRTRFYGMVHGGAVCCHTEFLECFELFFVMEGSMVTGASGAEHRIDAGEAAVHLPGGPQCARWSSGSKAVVLRVERGWIEPLVRGAMPLPRPAGDPGVRRLRLVSGLGRTLFDMCARLWTEADQGCGLVDGPAHENLVHYAVALIVEQLLAPWRCGADDGAMPPYLRRTVEFIESNLDRDLNAATLVGVAGVSSRTLQQAFARHLGKGPLTYVKHARLARVREELRRASPWETTVTEVATRWGFTHLSNFSRSYALLFGESPSRTLRAAR